MTPTPLSSLITSAAPDIANHLWQSTAFAAAIWLLTLLLRRNHARIRCTLWLAASIKFLLPFSLLITLGTLLPRPQQIAPPSTIYSAIDTASQPFTQFDTPITPTPATPTLKDRLTAQLPAALTILWLCGALTVLLVWYTRWRQVRATLKRSTLITAGRELEILRRLQTQSTKDQSPTTRPITLLRSPDLMEPGIFGILRPTLLWPHRLSDQLEDQHIEAILAHETIHVRRRDNLTAAFHMLVEAVFWFHPIVWWMERRMIEERERACDEAVVQQGGNPETYAESLLKACRFCLESPLPCVAGITGADLSRRVRSIMTVNLNEKLSLSKKILLAVVGVAFLIGPFAAGLVHVAPLRAQLLKPTNGPLPSFEVATIKPSRPDGTMLNFRITPSGFNVNNATAASLIRFAYSIKSEAQMPKSPGWIGSEKFDIEAKIDDSQVAAIKRLPPDQRFNQYSLMLQSLLADRFKLKLSTQMKDLPVYALVIAKGGPKLKEVDHIAVVPSGPPPPPPPPGSPPSPSPGRMPTLMGRGGQLKAGDVSMAFFTGWLSRQPEIGQRIVIDATGLKGTYDFQLNWAPDETISGTAGGQLTAAPLSNSSGPSIFTALQEQLGLKLEPRKAPVEVLVLDHIEKPTGDAGGEAPQAETPTPNAAPQAPIAAKSPSFEVVSVRQSKPGSKVRVGTTPDGYSETDLPLKAIISNAYGIRQELISGAPGWTESTAYDINAKEDESTAAAMQKLSNEQQGVQTRLMLQAVLADRFHLKVTRDTKESPIYHLVIARSGFKLKQADPKNTYANGIKGPDGVGTGVILTGSGQVIGQAIPISMLATNLTYQVDRSVIDKTGLTGKYDFTFKWAPDQGSNGAPAPDDSRPSLFTALQEQLGLKLEPAKGPVESLVIDHVEPPTEN